MPCDVAIIGAGPYGLAAAAHLKSIRGLDIRLFGRPMSFWNLHMPAGMLLRSPWVASHISDPEHELSLDAFRSATSAVFDSPVPLEKFVEYGRWFHHQTGVQLDSRLVHELRLGPQSFDVILDDGERISASRVVVAVGIESCAWRPELFRSFGPGLISHSCDHRNFQKFAGKEVVIVGGGQSALETAALLHESGAKPLVVMRGRSIIFLRRRLHNLGAITRMLYAPPDVGPAGVSHIVARPRAFRLLPRGLQNYLGRRSIRPAGANWLESRLQDVPIITGALVQRVAECQGRIQLRLSGDRIREADHVILATGYRVNLSQYSFLPLALSAHIQTAAGAPLLSNGFQSSVPGLHFIGAAAAYSFGPLMRFVAGTSFAGPALSSFVARQSSRRSQIFLAADPDRMANHRA